MHQPSSSSEEFSEKASKTSTTVEASPALQPSVAGETRMYGHSSVNRLPEESTGEKLSSQEAIVRPPSSDEFIGARAASDYSTGLSDSPHGAEKSADSQVGSCGSQLKSQQEEDMKLSAPRTRSTSDLKPCLFDTESAAATADMGPNHSVTFKAPSEETIQSSEMSAGGLCSVLVGVPVMILTAAFVLFFVFFRGRTEKVAGMTAQEELSKVCDRGYGAWHRNSCQQVIASMMEAMDPSVPPCSDFYGHVCGRWQHWKGLNTSQLTEHIQAFNFRVSAALLNVSNHAVLGNSTPSVVDQMARFYSGCFAMSLPSSREGGNVTDVLSALDVDATTCLRAANFGSFLEDVVSTSLRTGLASFITISFKYNAYRIDVGETLASTFTRTEDIVEYAEIYSRSFGNADPSGTNASPAILALDQEMNDIRLEAGRRPWFAEMSPDQMQAVVPGANWKRALARGLPGWLANVSKNGHLEVRDGAIIRRLVDHLRSKPLESAALYSLAVLLSQVMKYKASMAQSTATFTSRERIHWCLEQTATYFSFIYPQWVAKNFQDFEDVVTLRSIFRNIVATLMRDNKVNGGVRVNVHRLEKAKLLFLGETENAVRPSAALPVPIGNLFLPNVARLIGSRVGLVAGSEQEASLQQLRGHLGFSGDDFVVATAFVSDSTVYSAFAQEDTRYATVAYAILRTLFESEAEYDPDWAKQYVKDCFASSVASSIGPRVPDNDSGEDVKLFMGNRWSAQLAWALDPHNKSLPWNTKFARFFFHLLCYTRCGEPRARDECNDLAAFWKDIGVAYNCAGPRLGLCNRCTSVERCKSLRPTLS